MFSIICMLTIILQCIPVAVQAQEGFTNEASLPPPALFKSNQIQPPIYNNFGVGGYLSQPPFDGVNAQAQGLLLMQLPADATADNNSFVLIENKRFIEPVTSRCWSSTIMADTKVVEPMFVLIKPGSEMRINATAPLPLIQLTGFDPRQRTIILIHGFTQSYPETEWLRKVRGLFEMHTQLARYNLIIMDWGTAAESPYPRAAAMTSLMGTFLANFLVKLMDLGADRLSFHIIAHSLGAHVAGFAGKRIRPRIGRITALDPAGPCFGKLYSNSPTDRLSADDAIEVDVYHYDDDFLGLGGQHGQFDVYVNGGASQPGATDNLNSMFGALITVVFRRKNVLSESHTRSIQIAMTDLEPSRCEMVSYECNDYASFMNGECGTCDDLNNQCYLMSFPYQYDNERANNLSRQSLRTSFPGKRLYISTKATDPYCLFHEQILVRLEPRPDLMQQATKNKWRLHLELIDDTNGRTNVTLANLMSTNVFSHLMLNEVRRQRIISARLHIRSSDGSFVPLQLPNSSRAKSFDVKIYAIEINYMSNIDSNVRRAMSSRLCPVSWMATGNTPYPYKDNLIDADTSAGAKYQLFEECFAPPPQRLPQSQRHQNDISRHVN